MHVVIDIPDRIYHRTVQKRYLNLIDKEIVEDAIKNGTPLPKGHGKLKDVDKIISDGTSKGFCNWYDEIKYAPTIIEADKEDE